MSRKSKRGWLVYVVFIFCMICFTIIAFAANDPMQVVNSLSDFFGLVRTADLIMLGFDIVQMGLSLKFHDSSQRVNVFLIFITGKIFIQGQLFFKMSAKEVKRTAILVFGIINIHVFKNYGYFRKFFSD